MAFLESLKASAFSEWLSISLAGFPTLIAVHSVGMAAVVGLSLVVAIRLHRPLPGIEAALLPRLLDVAVWGFTINLVTGLLIFIPKGPQYIASGIFLLKMLLVVVGATAVFVLRRRMRRAPRSPDRDGPAQWLSLLASASLFGAVITGRLIAYLSDIYR